MKTRVTKKAKQELKQLIESKGYWSSEVKTYLSQYDYNSMTKLDIEVKKLVRI